MYLLMQRIRLGITDAVNLQILIGSAIRMAAVAPILRTYGALYLMLWFYKY